MSAPAGIITSLDIAEELYKNALKMSFVEWLKEYGGGHVYIPMYKSTHRNKDIIESYNTGVKRKELQKQYNLSESRINEILSKEVKL